MTLILRLFPILLLLGLNAAPAAAQTTLRVAVVSDLTVLDPIWTTSYTTRDYGYLVYDTLFAQDANFQVQPQMVDRWTVSEDGKNYSFTLRDGLLWHDGTAVTAADCIASLRRWMQRDATARLLAAHVTGIDEVSDSEFRIKLDRPVGFLLEALAKSGSNVPFMMPRRVAETDPMRQITSTVGSGPFIFQRDEWRSGSRIVFTRNPNYLPRAEPASGLAGGKRALFDRIEWLIMPDAATTVNALRNGEVDMIQEAPYDLLPLLSRNRAIRVQIANEIGNQGLLRMNHSQPPFNNLQIRRAVAYALRQQDLMEGGIGVAEYFRTCDAMFGCGAPFQVSDGATGLLRGNLSRARELLAQGGYDGTPVVILAASNIPRFAAFSQVTAQALRAIGMNVDLRMMEWNQVVTSRAQRTGWNLWISNLAGSDIINPLSNFAVTGTCEGGFPGWSCDPPMEQLRRDFALEADPARSRELAARIQARAFDNVSYLPLGQFTIPIAYRAELSGVLPAPVLVFWNIGRR